MERRTTDEKNKIKTVLINGLKLFLSSKIPIKKINVVEIINKIDEKSKKNIKILVSGTGKGFTKLSLQKKLNSNFYLELIECCVELDGVSKDTYSNANETSKWVNKNNIKEILLITSNYHMPRSILEFNNIMPNLKILPYPIKPEQHKINEWLKSFETFSLVFIEYCKYIVSNIRVKTL